MYPSFSGIQALYFLLFKNDHKNKESLALEELHCVWKHSYPVYRNNVNMFIQYHVLIILTSMSDLFTSDCTYYKRVMNIPDFKGSFFSLAFDRVILYNIRLGRFVMLLKLSIIKLI